MRVHNLFVNTFIIGCISENHLSGATKDLAVLCEGAQLWRRHHHLLLSYLHILLVHLTEILLQIVLVRFLFPKGHDQKLVLPLACLDLLFHKCLLCLHRLDPCRKHINLVKVLLLHLAEPFALLSKPLQLSLQPDYPFIVLEAPLLVTSLGHETRELPLCLLHVSLIRSEEVLLVVLHHMDELRVVV